ncbi:MAG: hypothetical protein HY322_00755 [Betaproteobacteria bacterium]|nr:hypothetical protein [Betaproteobacteria bacterium]
MAQAPKPRSRKKTPGGQVLVRMYRHGLGDCFLLRFPKEGGNSSFTVLIDCGLIGVAKDPKPTMQKVVASIAEGCGSRIDIAVMTHEHWDHASGFSTQQAQDAFDNIDVGEVWYAWTEDPENELGKKLRKERAAKVKALHAAAMALRGNAAPLAAGRAARVETLLQFFGVESTASLQGLAAAGEAIGKTRSAFEYLGQRRGVKVSYRYPTKAALTLPGVDGVRVYVLGPPEDEARIKRSSPTKKGKEVYEFALDAAIDDNLAVAFERLQAPGEAGGPDCPFEENLSLFPGKTGAKPVPAALTRLIADTWDEPEESWRKIELDWTAAAETLALNLDSHTNNTCLVLAFELVKSGQVLLFAADAQVGNWLSWQDTKWTVKDGNETRTVTGPDLLQRVVFYKVGHHGSHNATLRTLGLEQMTSDDLIAFVPVSKEQAKKNRWDEMPFEPLVKRLREKTGGRLVFSDQDAPKKESLASLTEAQRKAFTTRLTVTPLFYEYSFQL